MPGVLQITFYTAQTNAVADQNNQKRRRKRRQLEDLPRCWSLPAVVLPESTPNEFQHPIVLQERVARALGLMEGDSVAFSLSDYNSGTVMMVDDVDPCFHGWLNHNNNNSNNNNNGGLLVLQISIDPSASFDVAIEANSERTHHMFAGTRHTPMGNFLVCTAAQQQQQMLLKLNEQSIFGSLGATAAIKRDLKCSGMLLQVEGLVDSFDGAGCGYCIYASSPLSRPKPSDLLVQGYRFLGANNNDNNKENATSTTSPTSIIHQEEAAYFGLLEALQWVNRLDFQIVWIVGSSRHIFRQVLLSSLSSSSPLSLDGGDGNETTTLLMKYLHKQIVDLLEQARKRRIQFKFLASDEQTGEAMDLATRAVVQRQNETWCHWATINYQCQRPLPFSKSLARQVSI